MKIQLNLKKQQQDMV